MVTARSWHLHSAAQVEGVAAEGTSALGTSLPPHILCLHHLVVLEGRVVQGSVEAPMGSREPQDN